MNDPIIVAGDGAEILDESEQADEWTVFVAEDTEVGEKIHQHAAERGQNVEEFVIDAVESHLGEQ